MLNLDDDAIMSKLINFKYYHPHAASGYKNKHNLSCDGYRNEHFLWIERGPCSSATHAILKAQIASYLNGFLP